MHERLFTRSFVQLLATQAAFGYAFSTFSLLPKYLASVLQLDSGRIGSVMGAQGLTAVFCVPLVGFALDHRGRRPFLLAGTLILGLSALGFAFVDGAGAFLYALRLAQGVAFACYFVAGLTLAADLAPRTRMSEALGLFGVTNLVMNAVAPAATEAIAARYGWEPAFLLSASLAVVATGSTLALDIPTTPQSPRASVHLSDLLRLPCVLRPSMAIGLTAVTLSMLFVFHQPYALENGIENVSGFFLAYALGAGIARIGFGSLADRRGHLRIARLATIPYALSPLILIDVDPIRLLAAGLTMGVSHGFLYPSLNTLVVAGVDASQRGAAMGIFLGAFNLGFAIGPPALGRLSESAGYPWSFTLSAVFGALALACLVLWSAGSGAPARPEAQQVEHPSKEAA